MLTWLLENWLPEWLFDRLAKFYGKGFLEYYHDYMCGCGVFDGLDQDDVEDVEVYKAA